MFTIPPLTSDILVLSLDGESSPSININLSQNYLGSHSQGWGFGWYPGDEQSAMVTKDPAARNTQVLMDALTDWAHFRSTVFFCKVRGASKGYSLKETQPFSRSFAGRDWLFMHNGDVDKVELEKLHGKKNRVFEPIGNTDSELAFCNFLSLLQEGDTRKLSDVAPEMLHAWWKRLDMLGSADMTLSDGDSVVCFHGTQSPKAMYYMRIQPPNNQELYIADAAQISLSNPRDTYRTALMVTSMPFASGNWFEMLPGQMIIARRGTIVWDSAHGHAKQVTLAIPHAVQPQAQQPVVLQPNFMAQAQAEQSQEHVLNARAMSRTPEGAPLAYRVFEVKHTTHYEYSEPVEHSTHVFRLQPTDDPIQEVVSSKLAISSVSEEILFEDVFGNQAIHCIIDKSYTQLTVEATSRVKIFAAPPDDHSLSRRRTSIPLAWMPWQRQMMMPYLLPAELPESQLTELTEYAMSFVKRNDYNLLKTLEDMNVSIYRDYKYVSGSTSINTTPFEVYTSRNGVCQDFANLLICLTRLLSIPARYRMGYIYTGASYSNKIQSDASHAWAEVYLPYVGWRGFDPTNGCMVTQDHIRVACGRNYGDATPTSGTIYKGGGTETLTVDVKMTEIVDALT